MRIVSVTLVDPMKPPSWAQSTNGISTSILQASAHIAFEDGGDAVTMYPVVDTGQRRRIPYSSIRYMDYETQAPPEVVSGPSPKASSGSKQKAKKS